MSDSLELVARHALEAIDTAGTRKRERVITSPQSARINARDADADQSEAGQDVINLCANNYLGLANDPRLIEAAKQALDSHGFGMASVRFICGTQDLHKDLEARLASYLGVEDVILFPSCFDANGGIFEPLLGPDDAIISDALNHASIIDGVRLCKAQRFRYANNDMDDLERQLVAAKDCPNKLIVTDGVFSMDGIIADLPAICDLAEAHGATVMVDDCHATGFIGARGAGTPEYHGVEGRVHILTGTFGKALGGASGGYVAGERSIIELLRQRARPYLFSNAIAPAMCAAAHTAIDIAEAAHDLRQQLTDNAARFRRGMAGAGFSLIDGHHPIIPVMIGDAALAARFADALLVRGVYVIAFSYPVVPQGKARIRTQMSAAHTSEQIDFAISAFRDAGQKLKILT